MLVGEGVVLAVVGHPGGDRALDGHRARGGDDPAQPRLGLEGAVREQPVEADRDAQAGDQVHHREHDHVVPVQGAAPELPAGQPEAHERQDRDRARQEAVQRLVGGRLDVVGARNRVRLVGGRGGCRRTGHRGGGYLSAEGFGRDAESFESSPGVGSSVAAVRERPLWNRKGGEADGEAHGPLELGGRRVPVAGARGLAHAHRQHPPVRGPRAPGRGGHRARGVAPAPGAPLPPQALVPAPGDGPPAVGRRPQLQHRLPRAPDRASGARARSSSCGCWPAGSSASAWTAPSRCGSCGWSRGSRTGASRSSTRPTTAWSTASPAPT